MSTSVGVLFHSTAGEVRLFGDAGYGRGPEEYGPVAETLYSGAIGVESIVAEPLPNNDGIKRKSLYKRQD
jgi:hypothetical protein